MSVELKKAIVLSKNYESYRSGYYHQDLVDALTGKLDVYVYGSGYDDYNINDNIYDVINKSDFELKDIDYIIFSTSWDDDKSKDNVDPHPKIKVGELDCIKKVYFLNKEYKKLPLRFDFCRKNNIDYIFTVHPDAAVWAKKESLNIMQSHFGINLERFDYQGEEKCIDFSFTGSLHSSHLDARGLVKKNIFREKFFKLKSNLEWKAFGREVINAKFSNYKIYWAEFGARNILFKNLLPFGSAYGMHLKKCKVFLNTPSAVGIFNTRFFELMASKTLIICPKVNSYSGLLIDGHNCIMYNPDMSDFDDILLKAINDCSLRERITANGYETVMYHTYDARVEKILSIIEAS